MNPRDNTKSFLSFDWQEANDMFRKKWWLYLIVSVITMIIVYN